MLWAHTTILYRSDDSPLPIERDVASKIPPRKTWKPQSWAPGRRYSRPQSSRLKDGFTSIRMFALDGVLQDFPRFGVDADFVFLIPSANDERVAQPASSRFLLEFLRDDLSSELFEREFARLHQRHLGFRQIFPAGQR